MSRRAASRQVQAFEQLLAPDSDDENVEQAEKRKLSKGRRKRSPRTSTNLLGFRLRDDTSSSSIRHLPTSDLDQLIGLFDNQLSRDVIQDVYEACGSQQSAMEALLAMGASTTAEAPIDSLPQNITAQPSHWNALPNECKLMILKYLTLRDISRAAGVSREFASFVRSQRRNLGSLVVPPDLSMPALRGLVAAFPAASTLDFSRWASTLRFPNEFIAIAAASNAGIADRFSSSALDNAVAVVPPTQVTKMSFSRCHAMKDTDVAAVCMEISTLKSIDLSRCVSIGDAGLDALARYRRHSGIGDYEDGDALETSPGEALDLSHQPQSDSSKLESPRSAVRRIARSTSKSASAPKINHTMVGIEEINVADTAVTSRGVATLLKGSSKALSLLSLDVSRCSRVSAEAIVPGPASAMRVLRAAGCGAFRSIDLRLPATSTLRHLVLAECRSLTELLIPSAPALECLSISGCASLTVLSLRCPKLTQLTAAGCSKIGSTGAVMLECPKLEEVSFFGCRALDTSVIEGMLPSLTSSCRTLDLRGCVSIGRIVVTDASMGGGLWKLKRLAVDGCSVLRAIVIAAPALTELSARACGRLMEVRLLGGQPKLVDFENCSELREVGVGGGTGLSLDSTSDGMTSALGSGEAGKRRLVLRGCSHLPENVRDSLRAAVLGTAS